MAPLHKTERKYIFGPVPSRRLGRSLGVDVIPRKVCTLDCVYCEVGPTTRRAMRRREYLPSADILAELRDVLAEEQEVDYITFSGSGEPTLNSALGEMIRAAKSMSRASVAVITNGTLLYLEDVRRDLLAADVVLPSLDAVSLDVFQRVNRPNPLLQLKSIVEGMKTFRREYTGQIWLEVLFVRGINDSDDEVAKMREVVAEIRPDRIQLNTVVRPPVDASALPVPERRLREIQAQFGPHCEVIGTITPPSPSTPHDADAGIVLALLLRRPMTIAGMVASLNVPPDRLVEILHMLEREGKVLSFRHAGEEHFRALPSN
jgi:wyosine [tRNA(Phe)-imidazoG37] synthetase (radical SAM superfamily)